ncbi:MAG: DUF2298 domain-containing protein [Thermomicrobiales bacterium]
MTSIRRAARSSWWRVLVVIFLAAAAVRLYGLNWDKGTDLHPDELFIAKIVLIDRIHFSWPPDWDALRDPARSGLNPRSADPLTGEFREFAYGALPLWITDAIGWLLGRITGVNWNAPERAYLLGRTLSALLSALTIVPVAWLGRAAGGARVGIAAALFAALAPMSIQLAHFFTTDSWLAFFVALCLVACVRAARSGSIRHFLLAGVLVGLAMATKGSVFTLGAPVAVAILSDSARRLGNGGWKDAIKCAFVRAAIATLGALLAFAFFEPYALMRPDVYLKSLKTQADIASGTFDVPFSRVYVGTTPLLYQLEQLLRWGYGPAAGVLAILGVVSLVMLAWRYRTPAATIMVSWLATYGLVLALSEVKFLRYLEPLAPVFAVAAGLGLAQVNRLAGTMQWRHLRRAAIPVMLLICALWTAAYLAIFAHEHPRLAASRWIYANVAPASSLTAEYWDDALPRGIGSAFAPGMFGYANVMMDPYRDLPPDEASDAIFTSLRRADFVVQSSQRVEQAVAAAPWRYPVQNRYFDLLRRGELGFAQAAEFRTMPSIADIAFDDRQADESFLNYDHPNVTIYGKEERLTRRDFDLAMSWALQRPWIPTREPPESTLLLDHPVGENPAVNDARWSASLTSRTFPALALWIVLLIALAAAGWPLAAHTFRRFPDRGWGLARLLALLVAAYPVWLGASLERVSFRAVWAILSLAVLAVFGWTRLQPNSSTRAIPDDTPLFRRHVELAFWAVFTLFLIFRLITPDGWHPIWGGEKPMEFAQINAISRSAHFPPFDPWYSDGYVNYYYYGFYLVSFLFKLTGIPSEIGFNLALPTMMAFLASGGFSVAAALSFALTRSRRLAILGGWVGVAALSVVGNLSAVRGLLDQRGPVDPFIHWTWNGSRAIENAITEFPFFSGLYADLHAHVIALPITVVLIALAYALVMNARIDPSQGVPSGRAVMATNLALIALVLGTLSATNAWDVPVYALLSVAAIYMASAAVKSWARRMAVFVGASLAMAFTTWFLFLPFHRHFVALFGQIALVHDPTSPVDFFFHIGGWVLIAAFGLATLFMPMRSRTTLQPLPVAGVAAAIVAILLLLRPALDPRFLLPAAAVLYIGIVAPPLLGLLSWLQNSFRMARPSRWIAGAGATIALAVSAAAISSGRTVLAIAFTLGVFAAIGWLELNGASRRFVCLLLAAAFFTVAGVELVVVADDLLGSPAYRMNTVFKFYNQIWVLLALSGAALIPYMLRQVALSRRLASRGQPSSAIAAWAGTGAVVATVVLLLSLLYPVLATGPRLAQRFTPGTPSPSLDALAWMNEGTVPSFGENGETTITYAGDRAAIAWLWQNVAGSPVIAEASIGPYRCNGSRISAATGLPTILGWERHEEQQRYPDTLPGRVDDVRRLYTSPNVEEKERILRKYNVAYVVVGDVERVYPLNNNECSPTGSADGIAAFDDMLGTTLEVAFTSDGTTIYHVLPLRIG